MKLALASVLAAAALFFGPVVDGSSLRTRQDRKLSEDLIKLVFFDNTLKVIAESISTLSRSAGDDNNYEVTLFNDWKRTNVIGSANYKCTNTNVTFQAFCNGQMTFDGVGTLQVQGVVSAFVGDSQFVAIIGGTGAYIGARGQSLGVKQNELGGIKNTAAFSVLTLPSDGTADPEGNSTVTADDTIETVSTNATVTSSGSNATETPPVLTNSTLPALTADNTTETGPTNATVTPSGSNVTETPPAVTNSTSPALTNSTSPLSNSTTPMDLPAPSNSTSKTTP